MEVINETSSTLKSCQRQPQPPIRPLLLVAPPIPKMMALDLDFSCGILTSPVPSLPPPILPDKSSTASPLCLAKKKTILGFSYSLNSSQLMHVLDARGYVQEETEMKKLGFLSIKNIRKEERKEGWLLGWLVLYGISTLLNYLMPNPVMIDR